MTHFDRSLSLRPAVGTRLENAAEDAPRIVDSHVLLKGARRLSIMHGTQIYTLHLTRQNKLLLTK